MSPAIVMNESVFALTLALLFLAPLAIAGVALINTGLGRSRSAAQALLGNLAILAVATILFALIGASLAGSLPGAPGSLGLSFSVAGKSWNLFGTGPFLMGGMSNYPLQAQLGILLEFLAAKQGADHRDRTEPGQRVDGALRFSLQHSG